MTKSQLVHGIELNIDRFKRRCRYILAKFVRKCCPKTLRGFDKKYPQLGQYKKDVGRLAYLIVVKTTFVIVVLPIIVIVTLVESLKSLFRKGK